MTVYIPVWEILTVLVAYAGIGILLFIPLVIWGNTFIEGNQSAFSRFRWTALLRILVGSALLWPFIIWDCGQAQINRNKSNRNVAS